MACTAAVRSAFFAGELGSFVLSVDKKQGLVADVLHFDKFILLPLPPPLTEPDGNAYRFMPTVKMMGTANKHHRRRQQCSVSIRTRQGQAPAGWLLYCLWLRIQEQSTEQSEL